MSRLARVLPILLALPVAAAGDDWRILQPPAGERDLLLLSGTGRARVEADGSATELPVAADERLTAIVEIASGWVAAGVRGEGEAARLTVWTGDALGVRRLPAPPGSRRSPRLLPVPLADGRHLNGLAWLEGPGPRALTVRAAEWTGTDWGPATTVSGPGPGSQTGLAGAPLADGTWLLVWSAFDGGDDEIVWSAGRGDSWSRPRRLAAPNSVPDVAPTVAATADGALAAWNRLEADGYRLYLARYRRGEWSAPEPIGGSGSLLPDLVRLGPRRFLLHRNAALPGWTVLEIDDDGRRRGRGDLATAEATRPVVAIDARPEPALLWPGGAARPHRWVAGR